MWTAVHEDRPVERAHELQAVADDVARDRIEILQDACATNAAPLVRRRVRPALVLRCAPDRFGRRVGAKASGFVERQTEVVSEWRLARVLGAVEPPFASNVRWSGDLAQALGPDGKIRGDDCGSERDEHDRVAHRWRL